jgi:three-Cys-motif partner protein
MIAMTTRFPFTHYYFADLDPANIAALRERCNGSPLGKSVDYFIGDSNQTVHQILQRILAVDSEYAPGRWSSLNLAFLDPEGLELRWETVVALAKPYSMDLIINYPQGGLNRSMGKAFSRDTETAVDAFFGGTDWRDIYAEHVNKNRGLVHRQLMDHYKGKLQDLGYTQVLRDDEVGDEPLMRNTQRRAPLYRLLFASKHPLGHEFWQKITQRDVHGQARLL